MHSTQTELLSTNADGSQLRGQNSSGEIIAIGERTVASMEYGVSDTAEWKLTCRIAASKGFHKSELLPKFLLYVCEQSLVGNGHRITEQRIGTQIFNRPTDYNPGEDNIVRSYARTLRKRLDDYFEGEGSEEPLRMVIPRGGYVPSFCVNQNKSTINVDEPAQHKLPVRQPEMLRLPDTETPATTENAAPSLRSASWRLPWVMGFICLIAGLLMGAAGWSVQHARQQRSLQGIAHPIWAELSGENKNTLIVPADSGLGILQNLTGKLVPLETYATRSYFSDERSLSGIDAANLADLRDQRYTSVVDLNITAKLMRLHEFAASRTAIRYAGSITVEDLKSSNVILLGSSHTNPWETLFEDRLNFKLQYLPTVDQSYVRNESPISGEQTTYANGTGQLANQTYGVIDYLPSLDGNGHVLIIQGLNMAATQAAADVLFDSEDLKAVLAKASRPDGTLRPFELLIQTRSIGATNPAAKIIATRFHS